MEVDYKLLLAKYIEHVGAEEGSTFVSRLYPNIDGTFEGYSDKVKFTAEELAALKECEEKFVGPA